MRQKIQLIVSAREVVNNAQLCLSSANVMSSVGERAEWANETVHFYYYQAAEFHMIFVTEDAIQHHIAMYNFTGKWMMFDANQLHL